MPRALAAIDHDLARYLEQARRLPVTHPDHAVVHAILNDLIGERERLRPWRPSRVLARR